MAKKGSKKSSLARLNRETIDFTRLDSRIYRPDKSHFEDSTVSSPVEDRRLFTPEPSVIRTVYGTRARYRLATRNKKTGQALPLNRSRLAFLAPDKVMVCVRRKKRRESIFSFVMRRISGGSGGGSKARRLLGDLASGEHRWSSVSNIRC